MEFEIHVEEEILEQQIIKLVLQPVVENAIYHGIKYKDGKGLIKITGVHRSGCINLTVYDNGKGMEPEVLEHIFDPKTGHKSKSGIGISNVQMRLQLYYGKEYGISYKSIPGEGTAATIRIPFAGGEAETIENNTGHVLKNMIMSNKRESFLPPCSLLPPRSCFPTLSEERTGKRNSCPLFYIQDNRRQ